MNATPQGFANRLKRLRADLVEQGRRVQSQLEGAFSCLFTRDEGCAARVIALDEVIDRVDVELERASVQLLTDATNEGARLEPDQLRAVLTIVKINNELERIGDAAVTVAEMVRMPGLPAVLPMTFQVMANSVIGIMRDVGTAYERNDAALAKVVLQSEDAVEAFKDALVRHGEANLATGKMTPDAAFTLLEIANQCERIADHCTNIAEQIIYAVSGAIVRHTEGHWVEVPRSA